MYIAVLIIASFSTLALALPTPNLEEPDNLEDTAGYGRFIACSAGWGSLSYNNQSGYPDSRIYSYTARVPGKTGVPYFYQSPWDPVIKSLLKNDDRATFIISMASTPFCEELNVLAEDIKCPQLILSGKLSQVNKEEHSEEFEAAKKSLFLVHPLMKNWPEDHKWMITKLNLEKITVINAVVRGGHTRRTTPEEFISSTENC